MKDGLKRSEAVLLIAECLIEPHHPDDPEKEAAYILAKMERFGMLPPYRLRTRIEKRQIDARDQYNYTHEWKKE